MTISRLARASFAAVTRHECLGRRPVAAGTDAARVLDHFGLSHLATCHPSARGRSFDDRAAGPARALERA